MLTDEQMSQPVRVQDFADAMMFIILETFARLNPKEADEMLEGVANRLLETGDKIDHEPTRSLVLATAQNLIQTESGAIYD